MASRAFTAARAAPEDYHRVYRHLIDNARDPVILHWLGDAFDPALRGYWGTEDIPAATDFVLSLIAENPDAWTASRSASSIRRMRNPSAPACLPV